ncbi:hypothetical protein EV189_3157 [Motilibacter rhizosphaerae]|uniref:Uncharacterized protein n=1 Tax=Motilibacter rhizosphaerae TaxID=598652 RepID=A0A4Q7NG27_9ACTN|nr:hypothetical protein [Motilibacter rhizosphaerae]RZS82762.1 hypothetical protein EV189_3157 [Motilibacter rhizosphaerae]
MRALPRSAVLAAWGGALLRGAAPADALGGVLPREEHHSVTGLGPDDPPCSPLVALGLLRRAGATGLALALPVPGDPGGLAGPPPTNAAALVAGEAVLAVGGPTTYALVPEVALRGSSLVEVSWRALPAQPPVLATTTLAEADRQLKETLQEATAELVRLDVARWRPEVAEALAELRRGAGAQELPADYSPRARDVLTRAQLLLGVADLALADPGGALSAGEIGLRGSALRGLAAAARRGVVCAVNSPLERVAAAAPATPTPQAAPRAVEGEAT